MRRRRRDETTLWLLEELRAENRRLRALVDAHRGEFLAECAGMGHVQARAVLAKFERRIEAELDAEESPGSHPEAA